MTTSTLVRPLQPVRRKVFISYHHRLDQLYYNNFSRVFSSTYESIQDSSVDRLMGSDDSEYVMRCIRENYITGTSCTLVLCGAQTRWRKFVDWEIKASLDKQHGLIGVNLPNNPRDAQGRVNKPDRLQDNIDSGYALWIDWEHLTSGTDYLKTSIELANNRPKDSIKNERQIRQRNG